MWKEHWIGSHLDLGSSPGDVFLCIKGVLKSWGHPLVAGETSITPPSPFSDSLLCAVLHRWALRDPPRRIFASEHAVLIGAGIGITPFASILQSIMYRWANSVLLPASWVRAPRHPLHSSSLYSFSFLSFHLSLSALLSLASPALPPSPFCVSSLPFLIEWTLPPHPCSLSPELFSGVLKSLAPNLQPLPPASPQAPEKKAYLPQLPALLDQRCPRQHEAPKSEYHLLQAGLQTFSPRHLLK